MIYELPCDGERKERASLTFMEAQQYLGGWVQVVYLDGPTKILLVHEEGKLKGLPPNPTATALFEEHIGPGDFIVGPAIYIDDPEQVKRVLGIGYFDCDECGASIPNVGDGLIDANHKESCSLHPSAITPTYPSAIGPLDEAVIECTEQERYEEFYATFGKELMGKYALEFILRERGDLEEFNDFLDGLLHPTDEE